jgi:hypothetical protein
VTFHVFLSVFTSILVIIAIAVDLLTVMTDDGVIPGLIPSSRA